MNPFESCNSSRILANPHEYLLMNIGFVKSAKSRSNFHQVKNCLHHHSCLYIYVICICQRYPRNPENSFYIIENSNEKRKFFKYCVFISFCSKPKTQRAKRELAKREPKIHENDKKAMLIKGGHTSEKVTQTLKDLVQFIYLQFLVHLA